MQTFLTTLKLPPKKLKDYEVLNSWAPTNAVYRVAVRERQHLQPLTDHLAETLGPEGFRIQSSKWLENAPVPCGLIFLTYEGTMVEYDFLGTANRYGLFVMEQVVEAMVMQYYQHQG